MKEKFLIFLALIFLVTLLIGLNAASYVQKEKFPDSELMPNRSTYNVGSTGTRAFYDLLAETGRNVTRWQKPPSALLNYDDRSPSTFVVIGEVRREFTETEIEHLKHWVSYGGRLIIIDRYPPEKFLELTNWKVSISKNENLPLFDTDPADQKQMTAGEVAAKPIQPTVYTKGINAAQPSVFATSINIERRADETDFESKDSPKKEITEQESNQQTDNSEEIYTEGDPTPPVSANEDGGQGYGSGTGGAEEDKESETNSTTITRREEVITEPTPENSEEYEVLIAPVIHLASDKKNILADFPHGSGNIVFLSDPYIVSNGGISLVDNAQAAINVVAADGGIIAFDEYHQGFGSENNPLISYFEGTPVIAFLLQFAALLGLIFFTQSRRFARPLPADEPNRLSKLEYVSAMAQLQERTKAFDLAIENVYKDFRRRVSRLVGVDNHTTSREDLADLIAERSNLSAKEIDRLMFKCEDIIHGEPTNKNEVVSLTSQLRKLENELGLQRRKKK